MKSQDIIDKVHTTKDGKKIKLCDMTDCICRYDQPVRATYQRGRNGSG